MEKQLEIDCLKAELRRERERTCLLHKELKLCCYIHKLIVGTDLKDWDGDIWGDCDESSSEEAEELEERNV